MHREFNCRDHKLRDFASFGLRDSNEVSLLRELLLGESLEEFLPMSNRPLTKLNEFDRKPAPKPQFFWK
jgi:hypothetical protein